MKRLVQDFLTWQKKARTYPLPSEIFNRSSHYDLLLRWELLVTRHGVPLGGDVIILVPERPEPWPHIRHNAKFKSALNSIPLYDPSPLSPVLYIQKKGYRLAKDPSWFCEGGPKGFFFFRKKTPPYPKLIIKIIISSSNTKFLMISKDLTNKKRGTLKNPEKKETRKMKKRTKSLLKRWKPYIYMRWWFFFF